MEFIVKTGNPHFFGSIILKVGRKRRQGDLFTVCKTVVDGQQRLTTFLIFMKVLCLKTGQTTMFDMQFRLMGQTLALCHGKNDIAAFEKVMASTSAEQIDNPAPGSRIIEAFNFFVKNLDETKLDIMTIMTNTQFVKIDLDEDEDEQQIFDTINSLGVNLTTSELLKNYFFSRETIQEYEAKWVSVFEKDDDVKAYWDTELETGRLKRAILNQVLDADTLQAKLKNAGDATTYTPDDNELWNGFENSKLVNLQSKGIIYLIESKVRPSNSAVALLGFNQYSLEHLMPKKWRNNWPPCVTDDLERQRDSVLLTLGNLAIITQSLNASIRDAAWDMKKTGNGNGKPGLALCASGLCTLYDVLTKTDWDEAEISDRAKWLFEQARTIWSL